jgi:hypothetical protein
MYGIVAFLQAFFPKQLGLTESLQIFAVVIEQSSVPMQHIGGEPLL